MFHCDRFLITQSTIMIIVRLYIFTRYQVFQRKTKNSNRAITFTFRQIFLGKVGTLLSLKLCVK